MSRPTDTERGARIVLAICDRELMPQLFARDLATDFWLEIHHQASAVLVEAQWSKAIRHG